MDLKEFGLYFARIRVKSGYESQRQLSLVSKVSNGTIARIEAGTQRVSPQTLKKLAPHLRDVTYDELMEKAGYIDKNNLFPAGNVFNLEKDFEEVFLKKKPDQITTTVAGQDITISPEELRILEEIRKHPIMFHELSKNPEKNVKDLIKMWNFIKQDMLKEDDEEYFDEDIIED